MLRNIVLDKISEAVDLAVKLSGKIETPSYPLHRDKDKINEEFNEYIQGGDKRLIGYYKEDKLIGIFQLYCIEAERYIQTKSVYISEDYDTVMDEFILYLRGNYNGYEMFMGFPKENISADKYFSNNGYECIDACDDMRMELRNFNAMESVDDAIVKVDEESFKEYGDFHDRVFRDIYWTSERILDDFNEWHIFVYKPRRFIEGCVCIKLCRESSIEIFALYVSEKIKDTGVIEQLISKAVESWILERADLNTAVYFVDDGCKDEHEAAEKIGFKYYSSYMCYRISL